MSASEAEAHALAAARGFQLSGAPTRVSRLGSGHIHDTFAVYCDDSSEPDAVLQRINPTVFPEPRLVVENVAKIAEHLRAGLPDGDDAARRSLRPIESLAGGPAYEQASGVWRAFAFVSRTHSLDTVDTPQRARAAARAFGAFAAALADFPHALRDSIPGFHDFSARRLAFETAVSEDRLSRAPAARETIEWLRDGVERLAVALPNAALDALPVRWVHNDCKINNLLFDLASDEALCVIDLDTVMRGTVLADFGDLVRTAVSRAPEDARDPGSVRPDPALYEALSAGYLEGAGGMLTTPEIDLLALAGPLITLETGLRFATDHLCGDRYFRISREGQNLDRARTQARLALRLLEDEPVARTRIQQLARAIRAT